MKLNIISNETEELNGYTNINVKDLEKIKEIAPNSCDEILLNMSLNNASELEKVNETCDVVFSKCRKNGSVQFTVIDAANLASSVHSGMMKTEELNIFKNSVNLFLDIKEVIARLDQNDIMVTSLHKNYKCIEVKGVRIK